MSHGSAPGMAQTYQQSAPFSTAGFLQQQGQGVTVSPQSIFGSSGGGAGMQGAIAPGQVHQLQHQQHLGIHPATPQAAFQHHQQQQQQQQQRQSLVSQQLHQSQSQSHSPHAGPSSQGQQGSPLLGAGARGGPGGMQLPQQHQMVQGGHPLASQQQYGALQQQQQLAAQAAYSQNMQAQAAHNNALAQQQAQAQAFAQAQMRAGHIDKAQLASLGRPVGPPVPIAGPKQVNGHVGGSRQQQQLLAQREATAAAQAAAAQAHAGPDYGFVGDILDHMQSRPLSSARFAKNHLLLSELFDPFSVEAILEGKKRKRRTDEQGEQVFVNVQGQTSEVRAIKGGLFEGVVALAGRRARPPFLPLEGDGNSARPESKANGTSASPQDQEKQPPNGTLSAKDKGKGKEEDPAASVAAGNPDSLTEAAPKRRRMTITDRRAVLERKLAQIQQETRDLETAQVELVKQVKKRPAVVPLGLDLDLDLPAPPVNGTLEDKGGGKEGESIHHQAQVLPSSM